MQGMDWDKCSTRAGWRVLDSWVREQDEQSKAVCPAHSRARQDCASCAGSVSSGSAWAEVERSSNKIILFVTELRELPPHSPEGDLPAQKQVKCYTATRGTLSTAPAELGVTLGEGREGYLECR